MIMTEQGMLLVCRGRSTNNSSRWRVVTSNSMYAHYKNIVHLRVQILHLQFISLFTPFFCILTFKMLHLLGV